MLRTANLREETVIATAADYAWFDDEFSALAESYCLTLTHGLTAIEFLGRLEATSAPSLSGIMLCPKHPWTCGAKATVKDC